MGNLILSHLVASNCPGFSNRLLDSYFFKLTLRSDSFELCFWAVTSKNQKLPFRGVLRKSSSENMQQIYRRTPVPKCDFNKGALQFYWHCTSDGFSPVNLRIIFRTLFPRTSLEGCFWKPMVQESTQIMTKVIQRYKKCGHTVLL